MSYQNEMERCIINARRHMDVYQYWRNRYYQYKYYDMIDNINYAYFYMKDKVKASYYIIKTLSDKGPKWDRKDLIKRIAKDLNVNLTDYGKLLKNK